MMPPISLAVSAGSAALTTFLIYMLAVFGLAALSNRLMKSKNFLSEYFLGSRGLGMWAFALTFAATAASGGSFTGFPSKIYTHGWILALWIGSYMVVPLCGLGFMGKRINQVARISGSITVPDVIRDRFRSPAFAGLTVALIVFFISVNLIAQFKSGALILKTLLADVPQFTGPAKWFGETTAGWSLLEGVDPQYFLCLFTFGIAVVVYTTYGGFHAVVWTDVMQGIVMVLGVILMVPLTLWAVGGLEAGTAAVAKQIPPVDRFVGIARNADGPSEIPKGTWIRSGDDEPRLFRTTESVSFGESDRLYGVTAIEILHPADVERVLATPKHFEIASELQIIGSTSDDERIGTATVRRAAGVEATRIERLDAIEFPETDTGRTFRKLNVEMPIIEPRVEFVAARATVFPAGSDSIDVRVVASDESDSTETRFIASDFRVSAASEEHGFREPGTYVTGPGPGSDVGFLPLSLAISFFFMWAISGSGQPHYWVRLMAFKDATTLRRSILMVAFYYSLIYLPLVVIFVCARVLLPGMEAESDRIMPAMAVFITENAGVGWLAGLLVAAPFAAVMSTVDSVLLVISSALVRDVYQRNVNPDASEKTIKWMTYVVTLAVGMGAMLGAVNPPRFLQDIIVYTGSGLASCFLAPMIYGLYWPRVNKVGAMSGMLAGFAAHLAMYVAGIWANGSFFVPYRVFNFDPVLVGLGTSFLTVPIVSLLTPAPPVDLVRQYFCRKSAA